MKVLPDTNVILDIALDRQPFVTAVIRLLQIAPQANLELYLTATTITDLYYITRRATDRATARNFILLQFVRVAGVDETIIRQALASPIADFEDAVQVSVAQSLDIPLIVTRNEVDLKNRD